MLLLANTTIFGFGSSKPFPQEIRTHYSLGNIGQWLIGVRISQGLSQKDLAIKLGVSEQQVSRDERNEYHGITIERAQGILESMNVQYILEGMQHRQTTMSDVALPTKSTPLMMGDLPPMSTPDQVAVYLRTDKKLKPQNAARLEEIFRLTYEAMVQTNQVVDSQPSNNQP